MSQHVEAFKISGMSCDHCVRAVREALSHIDGVVVESVEIGSAVVRYDDAQTSHAEIAAAIEEEGYPVTDSFEPKQ